MDREKPFFICAIYVSFLMRWSDSVSLSFAAFDSDFWYLCFPEGSAFFIVGSDPQEMLEFRIFRSPPKMVVRSDCFLQESLLAFSSGFLFWSMFLRLF